MQQCSGDQLQTYFNFKQFFSEVGSGSGRRGDVERPFSEPGGGKRGDKKKSQRPCKVERSEDKVV